MRRLLPLFPALLFGLSAATAAAPFDGAAWLRNPVFEGVEIIDLLHKEDAPEPRLFGPKNVHTLFRHVIDLPEAPASIVLYVTGDDYYKLYINGAQIVQGPEPGYPQAYPYYRLVFEGAGPFQAGGNVVAAHAFYQGLRNRVWNSADNRSGFMLAADVTYADGTTARFATNDTWRYFSLKSHAPEGDKTRTIGYQTQFAEDIDMRLWPVGWREAGFDDSGWQAPLVQRQDHQLYEQLTPPLQVYRVDPVRTVKKGEGHYFYDFGHEITGHTRIRVTGPAGTKLTVRHGEELSEPETVRYDMRAGCLYEEFPVLSGGDDVIEFYDYKAFRYMEVLGLPGEAEVWVDVRHHPFDWETTTFRTSDRLLQGIWEICKRGVQMGSQGGYLDCPTREKGQYLGDSVIEARSHLWLTGDLTLTRKCLSDFHQSQRICPGMMAVAPGSFMQEIAEYSLQYPLLLWEYYQQTGDSTTTEALLNQALPSIFSYFARYEDESGLLTGIDEKWVLVDWPKNLRGDYDYDYAETRANTVVNAFYYGAHQAAANLQEALGHESTQHRATLARLEEAFATRIADPVTGLYLDAPGSAHSSLHANAIPLRFGLTAGANPEAMVALIGQQRLNCGVYIASYVIEACFENGAAALGYDLLTSHDEHSWAEMLKHGATTCMEAWGPDQKWNTSWCHAWSSSPIYLIAERVLGLSPGAPGWAAINFAPPAIPGLPAMQFDFPIPAGRVEVTFTPEGGYRIDAPEGVPVRTQAPEGVNITVEETHDRLGESDRTQLEAAGWLTRVGDGLGVWIDVGRQRFFLVEGGEIRWQAACSTAAAGTGSVEKTNQTPLGWHSVSEKIGDREPMGRIFRSRGATGQIWEPGQDTKEDLVLTRILWLEGLEPGRNRGTNTQGALVDSKRRFIYIHGTNGEDRIGSPASHGCIRLMNSDVLEVYDMVPVGTPVLITE